jgi:hypothetical protein
VGREKAIGAGMLPLPFQFLAAWVREHHVEPAAHPESNRAPPGARMTDWRGTAWAIWEDSPRPSS